MSTSTPIERALERASSSGVLEGSVSEGFGLMPKSPPATSLPPFLRFVDECVEELPWAFQQGLVCQRLVDLPVVSGGSIRRLEPEEMLRLSMAYGFFAYSFRYAWEHGRERLRHGGGAWEEVPAQPDSDPFVPAGGTIARIGGSVLGPWGALRARMGRRQPCFEADFFTRNFRLLRGPYATGREVSQDGCETLFHLFGTETEETFLLGLQEVTARFNCIPALIRMQRAMASRQHDQVVQAADEVTALWGEVVEDVFMRFDTRIDPAEWAATVGTWTASPFPGRDGFSGMFFPAFHILDVLLGRVRYESVMGELILHARAELPRTWRELFVAISEADLRAYCSAFCQEYPALSGCLVRLEDAYQHFFLIHRRKVFAFEYQGIVTGRNSTNAGIAVNIKDRTVESVFSLATWNEIDDLLQDSGTERPLEPLTGQARCPFSGGGRAEAAPRDFSTQVATSHARPSGGDGSLATQGASGQMALPRWRPLRAGELPGAAGIVVDSLPIPPRTGDRVVLWLDEAGARRVEGDFVGDLQAPFTIRTVEPVEVLHRLEVLRGMFARGPGQGAHASDTKRAPLLVLAEGRHSALASTLAPHALSELFVVVEGDSTEVDFLAAAGVPSEVVVTAARLRELSASRVSEGCGHAAGRLRELRDEILIYVSGSPGFVRRANAWLAESFLESHEPATAFFSELRARKRYRPLVHAGGGAREDGAVMYPWDVIGARQYPLRVVLAGRVLDLTEFQALHYGGTPILRMLAGTDITAEFSRAHPRGQIRMPEVHEVASFSIPRGLGKLTRIAFAIARAANVLGLLDEMLAPYRNVPRLRTQRLCRILEALDAETLWSSGLAEACGGQIQPSVQEALRARHQRTLAVLENTLRSGEKADLSGVFAGQYNRLYEDVLGNLVRGLHESAQRPGKPVSKSVLARCYERHLLVLLERSALTARPRGGLEAARWLGRSALVARPSGRAAL